MSSTIPSAAKFRCRRSVRSPGAAGTWWSALPPAPFRRGRPLVALFASGTIPALAFTLPLLKGGALLGVDLAQIQKREPETHTRLIAQLFDWLASGQLQPVVGKVVPFEKFREAFKTMQSRSALGKMIVKFG